MDVATRLRAERATSLCLAIADCHPSDAAQIMAAALEQMRTDGPTGDVFGTLQADAAWWAETAPQQELQAYAYAAIKQLGARALGPTARARFIAILWQGLSQSDKRGFLDRVTGGKG